MQFIKLNGNPMEMPEKKVYFDDVGTPKEKRRKLFNFRFSSSDWQMDPTLELKCPVCHNQSEHKAPAGWWSIWQWGLDGRLSDHLKWMLDTSGKYRCPHCGTDGFLDDSSLGELCKYVEQSVGNMPESGADWAQKCYERFMTFHRWGFPEYLYDTANNPWVPNHCDCSNCQKVSRTKASSL